MTKPPAESTKQSPFAFLGCLVVVVGFLCWAIIGVVWLVSLFSGDDDDSSGGGSSTPRSSVRYSETTCGALYITALDNELSEWKRSDALIEWQAHCE